MALVFSCIASHTPLLMPTIGKGALATIGKTEAAMKQLEQELYTTHPDTLIVISPHGDQLPDAMTINLSSTYRTNFQEFGDLTTKVEWKPNTMLIDRIREDSKEKHLPLVLDSKEDLDYGTAVALWYLTQHLPNVKIVPVITSGLDMPAHVAFGKELKDEILASTDRIAVIASADLSHTLTEKAPGGFSERGVALDEHVNKLVAAQDLDAVLQLDDAWIGSAQACGAKVLGVLAGIMGESKHKTTVLSYESPFGVGYLVAEMKVG
jgi:MEMO1 family protein